ncbi:MAG: DUF1501 domain-containing protein [Gammaproteobacteria bacterium]|nr:DUF1501 domain-containing protein [Gammaproteobacteria bacterium]
MRNLSRRKFLNLGTRALCGAGLALGSSPWHTLAHAANGDLLQHQDYRALVCIYLGGGSDGFNLLVPTDTAEYNEYATSRQHLAVAQSQLSPLSVRNAGNPGVGLNNQAAALLPLYDEGRLSFVANVGTLIEPTDRESFENHSVALPEQLFSHSDQEIQWQQLQGGLSTRDGWGALAAQYLADGQERDYLTSITLAGSNYWQTSRADRPFSVNSEGVTHYAGMDSVDADWQRPRREAFQRIMQAQQSHVFAQAYADLQQRAFGITEELGAILDSASPLSAEVPAENYLAEQLAMVARLINVRSSLGMSRQIFYVNMGGWDVHDNQSSEQPELFGQLAEAMSFFQGEMDHIGMSDSVTAFTASDFGRTLTSNGDGTDHGWGNHHMVMGGAVNGGDVVGAIPRMAVDGPDSVYGGRVIPTLSASQYAASLLRWVGLEEHALDEVLPQLGNFNSRDLGLMLT